LAAAKRTGRRREGYSVAETSIEQEARHACGNGRTIASPLRRAQAQAPRSAGDAVMLNTLLLLIVLGVLMLALAVDLVALITWCCRKMERLRS
jgi:hypothetical protein